MLAWFSKIGYSELQLFKVVAFKLCLHAMLLFSWRNGPYFPVLVSLLCHPAPALLQESFLQPQLDPEQVVAHPAHAQALAISDILIPMGQVMFSWEQRATQLKTSKVLSHLFRPHSPVEEEDRSFLLFILSLLDTSFRLLTKCYLASC